MAAGDPLTDEIRDATTTLLWDTAPELRAAAAELERTGPGTVEERPTLISGLRQAADGLEELAGVYELKNCAQKGLEFALLCRVTPDPLPHKRTWTRASMRCTSRSTGWTTQSTSWRPPARHLCPAGAHRWAQPGSHRTGGIHATG